jgi:hypothetical protein
MSDSPKTLKMMSSIILTGKQIKDLVEFCCPDDGDEDQLESEIVIQYFPNSFKKFKAGTYAWFAEYPEEGSINLDE